MNNFIKNLGRTRFYLITIVVLVISDCLFVLHLYKSFIDQEKKAIELVPTLSKYGKQFNLDFVNGLFSIVINSVLTAMSILIVINFLNYFLFLRNVKFSYKYVRMIVKLSIPLTLFTGWTLSKEQNPEALIYLVEGFIFCLIAYAFRFYPQNES